VGIVDLDIDVGGQFDGFLDLPQTGTGPGVQAGMTTIRLPVRAAASTACWILWLSVAP